MKISMIAAMSKNRVIGRGNDLPWHLPEDLKYFREKTKEHVLVMGRKTYDSVGKPLPNRETRVVSRQKDLEIPGVQVFQTLKRAIDDIRINGASYPTEEVFITGGGEIYKLGLPIANCIYLTVIDMIVEDGDTFFPEFDLSEWNEVFKNFHPPKDGKPSFTIYVYEKKQ